MQQNSEQIKLTQTAEKKVSLAGLIKHDINLAKMHKEVLNSHVIQIINNLRMDELSLKSGEYSPSFYKDYSTVYNTEVTNQNPYQGGKL